MLNTVLDLRVLFFAIASIPSFSVALPPFFIPPNSANRTRNNACPTTYSGYYTGEYVTEPTACSQRDVAYDNKYYYSDPCRVEYCNDWEHSVHEDYWMNSYTHTVVTTVLVNNIWGTGNQSTVVKSQQYSTVTQTEELLPNFEFLPLPTPCCGRCTIRARTVQLHFWPDQASTGAPSPHTILSGKPPPHNSPNASAIYADSYVDDSGFTFKSPSVYIAFTSIGAFDFCGKRGKDLFHTTVGFDPSELSSIHEKDWINCINTLSNGVTTPGNHLDLTTKKLLDYAHVAQNCSTIEGYYYFPKDPNNHWVFSDPCHPIIALPERIKKLQPEWENCVEDLNGGFYDPPRTLTRATVLVPTATPGQSIAPPAASQTAAPPRPPHPSPAPPQQTPKNSPVATSPAIGIPSPPALHPVNSQNSPVVNPPAINPPASLPANSAPPAVNPPSPAAFLPENSAHSPVVNQPTVSPVSSPPNPSLGFITSIEVLPPLPSIVLSPQSPLPVLTIAPGVELTISPIPAATNPSNPVSPVNPNPSIPLNQSPNPASPSPPGNIVGTQSPNPSIPINQSPNPASLSPPGIIIGTQTLNPGQTITIGGSTSTLANGQTTIIGGTQVSLDPDRTAVVIGGTSTLPVPTPAPTISHHSFPNAPFLVTIDGSTFPANGASQVIIGWHILSPGSSIVMEGTTISLAPSATAIVVGSSTMAIHPQQTLATSAREVVVGSLTLTANSASQYVVGTQTLSLGGSPITVDGTTIALTTNEAGSTFLAASSPGQSLSMPALTEAGSLSVNGVSPTAAILTKAESGSVESELASLRKTESGSVGSESVSLTRTGSASSGTASSRTSESVSRSTGTLFRVSSATSAGVSPTPSDSGALAALMTSNEGGHAAWWVSLWLGMIAFIF